VKKKQSAAYKTQPDAIPSQGAVQKGMATRMRCTDRVVHPLSQGGWVAMLLSGPAMLENSLGREDGESAVSACQEIGGWSKNIKYKTEVKRNETEGKLILDLVLLPHGHVPSVLVMKGCQVISLREMAQQRRGWCGVDVLNHIARKRKPVMAASKRGSARARRC
jgi:hypothetical protein